MIDLKKLQQIYQFGKVLKLKDIRILQKSARKASLNKKEFLLEAGSTKNDVYFIRSGLVRCFFINEFGKETTFSLFQENHLVFNVDMILDKRPSRYYYETLEPSKVSYVDYNLLDTLVSKYPKLEFNRKFFSQKVIRDINKRLESFVLLTPEERYLAFIKENPKLTNRVPDKYIANILGITPVSLSRIRKRIISKKNNDTH